VTQCHETSLNNLTEIHYKRTLEKEFKL